MPSDFFPCCDEYPESRDHTFTACQFINMIWFFLSTLLKVKRIF